MPEMDGHRLTKLIKDDEHLKKIPVIIFSSLINEQMRQKGKELGADEQLSKPEIGHLITVMDELLARFKNSTVSSKEDSKDGKICINTGSCNRK